MTFRLTRAALIAAIAALLAFAPAAAQEKAPPLKVPPNLPSWTVTMSQFPMPPFVVWPIALQSDGGFTRSEVRNRASRPRMKALSVKPADETTRTRVFEAARTVINGFRFSNPDEGAFTHDAGSIRLRLAHADRSIEVGFDPGQPERIGVAPGLNDVSNVFNAISALPEVNGSRLSSPARGVPKGPLVTEAHEIVPARLRDWEWLELGVQSNRQDVEMLLGRRANGNGKLSMTTFDARGEAGGSTAIGDATDDQVRTFHECARTIINQFELRDRGAAEPPKAVAHCRVGIHSRLREVRVEFDVTDDTPPEWKQRLSAAIAAVRMKTSDVFELPSSPP